MPKRAQRRAPPARAKKPGPEALLAALGARVRLLREAKNQPRRELSRASGLSERFLADLEAGAGNISLARLAALCEALGISLHDLLGAAEGARAGDARAADSQSAGARKGENKNGQYKDGRHKNGQHKNGQHKEGSIDALLGELNRLTGEERREALDWMRARFGASKGPMVALLGLRGAGKSTVGRALATRLGVPFIELDARVEEAAGLSLAGIFSLHGEEYYRRLAREILAQLLSELDGAVIATGGSIVTDREALRLLTRRCRTVWLQATPEDHWRRVLAQGDERPSAASANAQAELRAVLQSRAPLYAQAEIAVDTSRLGVRGTVEAVSRALA